MSDDDDTGDWEQPITFQECTCEHDSEDHDWMKCTVEGCPCEGHWTE